MYREVVEEVGYWWIRTEFCQKKKTSYVVRVRGINLRLFSIFHQWVTPSSDFYLFIYFFLIARDRTSLRLQTANEGMNF